MLLFTLPNYDIKNGCGIVQMCISSADKSLPVIWRKIEWILRSEIFGKRKDFRQFDKYFFGIMYYINLLCTCVVKSF